MIIAIDGPAGSGKSTTARAVAERLGYLYLDTGAMYRAVALAFIRQSAKRTSEAARRLLPGIRIDLSHDERGLRIMLNGADVSEAIRQPEVSSASSEVAALEPVRTKLVDEQRRIAHSYEQEGGGVVLDGRDIGTVVFPEADVKFFMTASEKVRAERRFDELAEKTEGVSYETVLEDIRRRDQQDASRALAPLRKAEDAVELDTSGLNVEEQVDVVIQAVMERQNRSSV